MHQLALVMAIRELMANVHSLGSFDRPCGDWCKILVLVVGMDPCFLQHLLGLASALVH